MNDSIGPVRWRMRFVAVALAVGLGAGADCPLQAQTESALGAVELVCVDEDACGYATFQSHNQKVVSNAHGIFMTYLREDNEQDDSRPNVWRLLRSVDGGRTFAVVHEGQGNCRAPCLETDAAGNLYLAYPEYGMPTGAKDEFRFCRFLADEQFANAHVTKLYNAPCAAKYAMAFDAGREQFYIATQYGRLLTVSRRGELLRSEAVLEFAGPHATTQYPHLCMEPDGTLHHGWTTAKPDAYLYWDIHHMLSLDGARTWRHVDGTPLVPPIVPDDTGPTLRVTLDDESAHHTWLSGMLARRGKLHFLYQAQTKPPRQHYVRYDLTTHRRDVDRQPEFRGETIALAGLDGFFAARSDRPDATLYCVSQDRGRLACLASDDNGTTWYDLARSATVFRTYAIGGCREVMDDGAVIGSFTAGSANGTSSKVYFFRILADHRTAATDSPADEN